MRDLTARPIRLRHPSPFPSAFHHLQVAMPAAPGVDAQAVVVDLADEIDLRLVDRVVRRHWWSADHGVLRPRRATARDLAAEGDPVLTPRSLGWVDPAERAAPGFPLASDSDDVPRLWVRAHRDGAGGPREGWMPYTAVVARHIDARPDEPLAHPPLLGGFGAGADSASASREAWRAIVADDALWCWWTGLVPAASLELDPGVALLWADADLALTLRRLERGTLAPATLAAVDDGDVLVVGGACGDDAAAQRAAIARALWQLVMARALDDPARTVTGPGVVAHRADRRYAPDTAADRRRLLDPLAHVQLALDPRVRAMLRRRLEIESPDDAAAGRPPLGVETWTAPLAPDGGVVRMHVPQAVPLPLGAFRLDPALVDAAAHRRGIAPTDAALVQVPYPGW